MSWLSPDYDSNGRPVWRIKKHSIADWGIVVLITSPAWAVLLILGYTTYHYFSK